MLSAKIITLCTAMFAGSATVGVASPPALDLGQQAPSTRASQLRTRFTTHDAYRLFVQILAAEAVHTDRDTLVSNYMDRTRLAAAQSQQLITLTLDVDKQMTEKDAAENQIVQSWLKNYPTATERRTNPLPDSAKTLGMESVALVDQYQKTLKNSFTTDDFTKINSYVSEKFGPDKKPARKLTPPPGFVAPSNLLPGTSEITLH